MSHLSRVTAALAVALCISMIVVPAAWAQPVPRFERERVNGRDAVAREVLVKFRDPLLIQDLLDVSAQTDALSVERVGTAGTLRNPIAFAERGGADSSPRQTARRCLRRAESHHSDRRDVRRSRAH